jgi:hypothetical protein
MKRTAVAVVGVILGWMGTSGCAKVPPKIVSCEGLVLLNGQPLPNAEVRFIPMIQGFGAEYIAVGTTDDQGRLKLICNGQPGACAGENRLTVTEAPLPSQYRGMSAEAQVAAGRYLASLKNRPIPERYSNLAQSPLVVTVTPEQTIYEINLNR